MRLRIPRSGLWVADLRFGDLVTVPDGPQTLIVAGAEWSGTAQVGASGSYLVKSAMRIVGGAGWLRSLSATAYHNDAGVSRTTVLQALAAACGEPMPTDLPTSRLPNDFVRRAGPAVNVLNHVLPGWTLGRDGVVSGASVEDSEVGEGVEILDFDPMHAIATLKIATGADVVVGSILRERVATPQRVTALDIVADAKSLRVYATTENAA